MKRAIKILMVLLSYVPIKSVAAAAFSKSNELEAEIKSFNLRQKLSEARFRVIPTDHYGTTMDDARSRYSKLTGLQGVELENSMAGDLLLLKQSGIIEFDEKMVVSGSPSEHAAAAKTKQ